MTDLASLHSEVQIPEYGNCRPGRISEADVAELNVPIHCIYRFPRSVKEIDARLSIKQLKHRIYSKLSLG